ncbi:MYND finger family protein [Rutstroemia sp. NJR-2017a BVV2]|nr:MYND finger family protein [Rutstroemia sp. NJR-2017a BVV2]PQE19724.1 MYND finger family protein [Rutstroemia sp. NJR-2017a BVV2]
MCAMVVSWFRSVLSHRRQWHLADSYPKYCSNACQGAHWPIHKNDCKSPLMKTTWRPQYDIEKRTPAFIDQNSTPESSSTPSERYGMMKYLWGNVPAIDVVKYSKNEGLNIPEELHFLATSCSDTEAELTIFEASGDIRNIIKTLVSLPDTYNGRCEVVINDRDFDIVARNIILLLIALIFDPIEAADMMLHVWYSAFITESTIENLHDRVLPLFEDVCSKIRSRPEDSIQSKTWTFGTQTLSLVLSKKSWDRLPSYLKVPDGLSKTKAQALMMKTTLAPSRKDYIDRAFFNRPPAWRVCAKKFRTDGILLPFGQSRKEFNVPNPTFFQNVNFWPMMDSADPIEGWSVKEFTSVPRLARNDINGSLYYYLKGLIQSFCRRVKHLHIRFQFFELNVMDLPHTMAMRGISHHYFDRIEVSNIGDRGYLGPEKLLKTFSPLLKRKSQNPHATILGLFLNAARECLTTRDELMFMPVESQQVMKYMPISRDSLTNRTPGNADTVKFVNALAFFRDYDMLFDRFMKECSLEQLSEATGLRIKKNNTLIEKWPLRLIPGSSQEDFDDILASNHTGSERYVEWESMA